MQTSVLRSIPACWTTVLTADPFVVLAAGTSSLGDEITPASITATVNRPLARELGRADRIRLVDRFRSVLIPRRPAGRKSKAKVTAAYQDWKARVQGVELYRHHIRNWNKLT